jgi:hypothetical protein
MSLAMRLSPIFGSTGVSRAVAGALVSLLIGCAQTPPPSPTAAPDSSIGPAAVPVNTPAVVSAQPVQPAQPETPTTGAQAPSAPAVAAPLRNLDAKTVATAAALTPTGQSRYQCLNGKAPSETRNAIALPPGSDRICSRFPAMGPCQYERDACRAKGGRVIRFDDVEITKDVEREYDKQVQRFKLNAG